MKNIRTAMVVAVMLTSVLISCKKDKCKDSSLDGVWKGTFQRQGPGNPEIANVTLEFKDGGFTGSSDRDKYPAICNGTFYLDVGDKINFENKCVWTADFDWSFILDGEYEIVRNGDSLQIIKGYDGIVFWRDVYKLKKL